MTHHLSHLVDRLCRASAPPPITEWPARLDRERWYFTPELLSLHGSAAYAAMNAAERCRLSVLEAVSFFSLNLHGERFLIGGLLERAEKPGWAAMAPYLEHFLADEERHSATFGEFCQRYAGKVYRDHLTAALRVASRSGAAPGEADVLFVGRVLIFEEIADAYNRRIAADERVAPIARAINRMHHLDEARHLAFGRALLPELLARHAAAWDAAPRARVRATLSAFLHSTWRAYWNPDVYRDAGLSGVWALREQAFASESARLRRAEVAWRRLRPLFDLGLLDAAVGTPATVPAAQGANV